MIENCFTNLRRLRRTLFSEAQRQSFLTGGWLS
jgi:hypothetical protein